LASKRAKIAIVGAGQSGLQLGIGLLKNDYAVTLISDRSSEDILNGYITSSQGMFHNALENERTLEINFWEQQTPGNSTVSLRIADATFEKPQIQWQGFLNHPFQSVDQRIKFSTWLEAFKDFGGEVSRKRATAQDLENLSNSHDLVIVATGKGELSQYFNIDPAKTKFLKPMRKLACFYVNGIKPNKNPGVCVNVIPGIGEYFSLPGLSLNGICEMVLFEAIPGGAFDCFDNLASNEAHLTLIQKLLEKYVPWEAKRIEKLSLADPKGKLFSQYAPIVRKPIAELGNGNYIFGMGDVVAPNDPIGGQGANNASHCADAYLHAILNNEETNFTKNWMQNTYDEFWKYVEKPTTWSNMLLTAPKPHVIALLSAASQNQKLANRLANGFNQMDDLFPWILNEEATLNMIKQYDNSAPQTTAGNKPSNVSYIHAEGPGVNLNTLLEENKQFEASFSQSPIMQLIHSQDIQIPEVKTRMLDCIQLFSNHFQKCVMLRHILTEKESFKKITQEHLDEEYNHNVALLIDRNYRAPIWDPILEASSSWFTWKMLSLDNTEKTLLMHLILEASADIFFQKAHEVMKQQNTTEYFGIHAEVDEDHASMGTKLLENLRAEDYNDLLIVQQQGWSMLYTACNRIATLCGETKQAQVVKKIQSTNDTIRNLALGAV
jgi:flavin-dependent dehydrogenase